MCLSLAATATPRHRLLPGAVLALTLFGCAGEVRQSPPEEPRQPVVERRVPASLDQAGYRQMLDEALQWQARAAAVDGEWRDVQALIDRSREAAARGDLALAIRLAEEARFQAEMGYQQMQSQQRVSNPRYLKD